MQPPGMGTTMTVEAPAKVNLYLRVLGRREDGFHDLETLFQAVDLTDRLTIRVVEGDGVALTVEGADLGPDEDNLVVRAAHAFRRVTGSGTGLEIRLEKGIPAGAGLGGGSSDAGATLRVLDRLHGDPLGPAGLTDLAGALGSDVAFFAGRAGYALGTGRGEILHPLPALPTGHLVVGLPRAHVATGPAYAALARERAGGTPVPRPRLRVPTQDGTPPPQDWEGVRRLAANDFQPGVARDQAVVARALGALDRAGGRVVLLSGSGAAVFALPGEVEGDAGRVRALELAREAARYDPDTRFLAVRTLGTLPGPRRVDSGQGID